MNNNNSSKIPRMHDKNKTTNTSNNNINSNPGNNHSKPHKISYQKLSLSKSAKISNNKKDDKILGNNRNTNKEKSLPPIYEVGDNDTHSTNNKRKSDNNINNNSIDSNVDSYNKRIAYSNLVKNSSNSSRHTISNFNANTHKNKEINDDNRNDNASNTNNTNNDINASNTNPLVYSSPIKYSNEQFYSNSERKATNLDSFSKLNNNSKRSNLLLSNHSKRSNKDPLLTKPKSKKSYSEMKANIYASYTANLDDIFALYKANKREWLLEFEEKILDIQRSDADIRIINKDNSIITSDLFNFDPYSFNITPIADISKHLIRLYKFWILLFAYRLNFFIIPITLFLREIRQARIQIIDLEFFFNEEIASLLKIHYTNEEIKSEFEKLKKNHCNERIREIDYSENDHDGFVNFEVISVLLEHEIYDAMSTESEYIKEEIKAREHSNTNSSSSNDLTDENGGNLNNNNSISSHYLLNKQELFEETIHEFYSEYLLGNIEWQDQFSLTVFDESILQYDATIYKIIPKNQLGEFIVKNYKAWILIHFITLNNYKAMNDSKDTKEKSSYNFSGFLRNVSNSLRQINPNDEMLYLIELIKITKHFFSKEEIITEFKDLNKKYYSQFPENYNNLSNDNYIELFKHFEFKIESPASKEIIHQKRSASKNRNNFDNETKLIVEEELFSESKQNINSCNSQSQRQSHQYDDYTTTQNNNTLKIEQLIETEFQCFIKTKQINQEVIKKLINDNFSLSKSILTLISPITELSYFLIQKHKFMTLVNIFFQNENHYPLKVFLRLLYYNKNLSKRISNNHLDSEFLYNRNNQPLINFFFTKIDIIKELFYLKKEYSYESINLSSIMKSFNEDSLKKLNECDENTDFLTNYSTYCVYSNVNNSANNLNNLDESDFIHIDIEIILFELLLNHCEYDLSSGNSIKLLKDYECFITGRNSKMSKGFKDKNISEMMSKQSNLGSNISNNACNNTNSSASNINNEGNDIQEFTFREDTQKKQSNNNNNNNISKSHSNSNSNANKNNDESDENYSTIINRESQITQYSKINDTSLLILNTQNKNYTNTNNHNINEIEEDKYSKNFPFSETKSNFKLNNYSSDFKINGNSNSNNALFNTELSMIKNEDTINNINSTEENNLYYGKVTPKLTSSNTSSKQLVKKQDRDPYSKFKKMFAPKNYDCFIPILEENNSINNSFTDSNNINLINSNIDNNSKSNLRNLNIKKIFSVNNSIKHIPQAFAFYLSSIPFKVVSHLDNMIGELKEKANMNNENNNSNKELFDNAKAFKHHDLIVSQIEFDIISKRFNDISEEISKDNEEDEAYHNEDNKIDDKKKTKNNKKKANKGKDNSKGLKNNKTKNKNKNKEYNGDSDSDITKEYISTISKKYRINNDEQDEIKERKSIKYKEFLYDEYNNENESESESDNKDTSNKNTKYVKDISNKSKHSNKIIHEDDSDDNIKEEIREKSRKKTTKNKKKTKESIDTQTDVKANEREEESDSENNDKDTSNKRRSKSEIKHTKNTKNTKNTKKKTIKKYNSSNKVNNNDNSDTEEKSNDTNKNDTDSEENQRSSRPKSLKEDDAITKKKTKGKSKSTNKRKKK